MNVSKSVYCKRVCLRHKTYSCCIFTLFEKLELDKKASAALSRCSTNRWQRSLRILQRMSKAVGDILKTACENLQQSSRLHCLELKNAMSSLANSSVDYLTEESPANTSDNDFLDPDNTTSMSQENQTKGSQDISKIVVLSVIIFFTIFGKCTVTRTVHIELLFLRNIELKFFILQHQVF